MSKPIEGEKRCAHDPCVGDCQGPIVIDGDLRYVSVSKVQLFDHETTGGCERRWWFEAVRRIKVPDNPAQAVGREGHSRLEAYMRGGAMTLGFVEMAGRHLIPSPNRAYLIEHPIGCAEVVRQWATVRRTGAPDFKLLTAPYLDAARTPFIGYIDVVNPTGEYLTDEGIAQRDPDGTVEVLDWKFSSNPVKHGKRADQLPKTIQMGGYGVWATRAYPGLSHVRLSHVMFRTKGARYADKRTVLVPVATVHENYQRTVALVSRMREVAKAERPEDVNVNLASCDAYFGCPHKSYCDRPDSSVRSLIALRRNRLENPTMSSMKDKLLRKKPTEGGKSTPEGHKPPDAKAPTGPEVDAEVAKLKGEEKAGTVGAPVVPPDAPKSGERAPASRPLPEGETDPTLTKAASETRTGEATGKPKKGRKGAVDVQTPPPPKDAATPPQEPTASPSASPRNSENDPKDAPEQPDLAGLAARSPAPPDPFSGPISVPAEVVEAEAEHLYDIAIRFAGGEPKWSETPDAARVLYRQLALDVMTRHIRTMRELARAGSIRPGVTAPGMVLLVDVELRGVQSIDLWSYVVEKCAILERQYDAVDVRCSDKSSPLAFGGWKGALAALVKLEPPGIGMWAINHVEQDERLQVVVSTLTSLGVPVVRGL